MNQMILLFPEQQSLKPLSEQSVRLILKKIVEQIKHLNYYPHMFRRSFTYAS